jgi:hypothetical protein
VSRPATTPFVEAVYARLEPIATQDEGLDWPLLRFIAALSKMFESVEAVARSGDRRVPYSRLLDVSSCPTFALPFLGQFAGVRLRALKDAYARDAISRRGGRNRGRPDAIIAAAQEVLSGTKNVRLVERFGGDAYALRIITRPSETPSTDIPMTNLALNPDAEDGGGSLNTNWSNLAGYGIVAGSSWLNTFAPDPTYSYTMRLVTTAAGQGINTQFGAVSVGLPYRVLVPLYIRSAGTTAGGGIECYMRSASGEESAVTTVTGPLDQWFFVQIGPWSPLAASADTRVGFRQAGAGVRDWHVGDVTVVQATVFPDAPFQGARTPTTIVLDAAKTEKPAGMILTHQITDQVLIEEGTRTINAGTNTIDAATLADVT